MRVVRLHLSCMQLMAGGALCARREEGSKPRTDDLSRSQGLQRQCGAPAGGAVGRNTRTAWATPSQWLSPCACAQRGSLLLQPGRSGRGRPLGRPLATGSRRGNSLGRVRRNGQVPLSLSFYRGAPPQRRHRLLNRVGPRVVHVEAVQTVAFLVKQERVVLDAHAIACRQGERVSARVTRGATTATCRPPRRTRPSAARPRPRRRRWARPVHRQPTASPTPARKATALGCRGCRAARAPTQQLRMLTLTRTAPHPRTPWGKQARGGQQLTFFVRPPRTVGGRCCYDRVVSSSVGGARCRTTRRRHCHTRLGPQECVVRRRGAVARGGAAQRSDDGGCQRLAPLAAASVRRLRLARSARRRG